MTAHSLEYRVRRILAEELGPVADGNALGLDTELRGRGLGLTAAGASPQGLPAGR